MFSQTTPVFDLNYCATQPLVINQGGTSSGKTYAILQVLAIKALKNPKSVITVVGQDIPNLQKGAMRDFENIVSSSTELQKQISSHHLTDRVYKFTNGSVIEFTSYDNAQDAKNGKRQFLFANEANGIPYDVWDNLFVRTSTQSFIDFNPTGEFWLHTKILPQQPAIQGQIIHSTFRHNPFIAEKVRDKILHYEKTDTWRWQVYGLGEMSQREGLIYPHWQLIDTMPEGGDVFYGLDFGFNDPAALVRVVHKDKVNYVEELLFQSHLVNADLILRMQKLIPDNHRNRNYIYADSAEPGRITEIRRSGFQICAAIKNVVDGIDAVKSFPLFVHKRSFNLIKEIKNYVWKTDSHHSELLLDAPVQFNDHLMDAMRYAIYTHLKNPEKPKAAIKSVHVIKSGQRGYQI